MNSVTPATVLIAGASRGIGLELARQYRQDGWRVIATARDESGMSRLAALGAEPVRLDMRAEQQFSFLEQRLADLALDVCIYNAGVAGPRTTHVAAPSTDQFDEVMQTNLLGALRWIAVTATHVARAHGRLAFLSSKMGSIGLMTSESSVLYRASKAALNAVVKATALEWGNQGVTVLSLHPGYVRTDMGGAAADVDVQTSVTGLRTVIGSATMAHNGSFLDYTGAELIW